MGDDHRGILSVAVMMIFAGKVSAFVKKHPTLKMLALSFLILIGVMLVAEALGTHVNKGYIYFASVVRTRIFSASTISEKAIAK